MLSIIFTFGLSSLFIACGGKSTDSAEDTASAEPSSSPTTEPSNPSIEPSGEPEAPVEDEDGDGFSREDGDCDDNNPDIYPGAEDIPGDGIDQDCSGSDEESTGRILDDVLTGELIVTEIMNNPSAVSDDFGEWIEINPIIF